MEDLNNRVNASYNAIERARLRAKELYTPTSTSKRQPIPLCLNIHRENGNPMPPMRYIDKEKIPRKKWFENSKQADHYMKLSNRLFEAKRKNYSNTAMEKMTQEMNILDKKSLEETRGVVRWQQVIAFFKILKRSIRGADFPMLYNAIARACPNLSISRSQLLTVLRLDFELPIAGIDALDSRYEHELL